VQLAKVVGRLAEVVVADDPLGLPEPANLARDIFFQVDPVDAFGNRGRSAINRRMFTLPAT
jgi:hypothetical protein